MNEQYLIKLKQKLPKNGTSLIADKTNFSYAYVNMVLSGKKTNNEILFAAISIASEFQQDLKAMANKIEAL